MRQRPFAQVDVFSETPGLGNPVAVVLDGEGLSDEQMQRFARWTNLSETTFVLAPTEGGDYRVRIFTPVLELPFAGHPTLGTAHAWLAAGDDPAGRDRIVQECGAGLVELRRDDAGRLAFAAPPLTRYEPASEADVDRAASALGLATTDIVDAHWVDNGPGWLAVLLESAEAVLAVEPVGEVFDLGVVAPRDDDAFEVRAFFPKDGVATEDPVTGSLNAGLAQWLTDTGRAETPYVARQGTALGREGRVHVDRDDDGTIWVGGQTATIMEGTAWLG